MDSQDVDEKLIEALRDFPCLWKINTKQYRDKRTKENAWKLVSTYRLVVCLVLFCCPEILSMDTRRETRLTSVRGGGDYSGIEL